MHSEIKVKGFYWSKKTDKTIEYTITRNTWDNSFDAYHILHIAGEKHNRFHSKLEACIQEAKESNGTIVNRYEFSQWLKKLYDRNKEEFKYSDEYMQKGTGWFIHAYCFQMSPYKALVFLPDALNPDEL